MGPFATATEFCEFTGIGLPSDLARLQGLLDDASAEIRGYTGQVLSEVADDEVTFPSWSSSLIVLPQRPVTEVTLVEVDSVAVAATEYEFTRTGNLWRLDGSAWEAATVTYTHGYAEGSQDFQRIKTVCIEVAANAFTLNERGASEVLAGVLESAGYSPAVFLTPSHQGRLGGYCATVFA